MSRRSDHDTHDPSVEPLARGARLFDEGAYFAAHEVWEERWRITDDADERRLLQGLIQVAAGFHKLALGRNPDSAVRLLERGLAKLDACVSADGLDLESFRVAVRACARAPAGDRFDPATIPKLDLRR